IEQRKLYFADSAILTVAKPRLKEGPISLPVMMLIQILLQDVSSRALSFFFYLNDNDDRQFYDVIRPLCMDHAVYCINYSHSALMFVIELFVFVSMLT
ncbi:hypothetical protein PMAYCL1PPCAC_08892, partial [Pristionchus mayeri]